MSEVNRLELTNGLGGKLLTNSWNGGGTVYLVPITNLEPFMPLKPGGF